MGSQVTATKPSSKAAILAIGTAVPPNSFMQKTYPDFFFSVTNCTDKSELKAKFQRICERSGIRKRHFLLDQKSLTEKPEICSVKDASLDVRQDIGVREVPRLGKEAAARAIAEWGQPKSRITHLVFATSSGIDMPGADFQLLKLLGLRPDVKRVMIYQQGCFAGGTTLRIAKDLAENNRAARVLVVCSEVTALTFRAPSSSHLDALVGSALFGDGAAALIVGCLDPEKRMSLSAKSEKAIFEVHRSLQYVLPESDGAILGHLRECGLVFHLLKDVPRLISGNIPKLLSAEMLPSPTMRFDDLFWVVHPGGPAILDQMTARLELGDEKLAATRRVLSEYGNMSSASVLFVLDELRARSHRSGAATTGEGAEWGAMLCFGPGLTVEALLLKSIAI